MVITILMGLTIMTYSYIDKQAVRSKIKADILMLEAALEQYKADNGGYPPLDAGLRNVLTNKLDSANTATNFSPPKLNTTTKKLEWVSSWTNIHYVYMALAPPVQNSKQYVRFTDKQIRQQGSYFFIVDPMGNPYCYIPGNPQANPGTFDLFSAGRDGVVSYPASLQDETFDDIGNW